MKETLFRLVNKFNHLSYESAYKEDIKDTEYINKLIIDMADIIFDMCEKMGVEANVEPCMDNNACYPEIIIPAAVRTGEI